MIRKFRKPIAYFMMATMLMGTTISCQRQNENIAPDSNIEMQNEKLTLEEVDFLNELDDMIAFEITKAEKMEVNVKGNNTIDPSNPFEYFGKEIESIYACVAPHVKEALEGDLNNCPNKDQNFCGKTQEAVLQGSNDENIITNFRKLGISCVEENTNYTINQNDLVYYTELGVDITNLIEMINADNSLNQIGKEIHIRYVKALFKIEKNSTSIKKNAKPVMGISKGFENMINNSNLLSSSEKIRVASSITAVKYVVAFAANYNDNSGNDPLDGATVCGVLCAVLSSAISFPCPLCGFVSALAWSLA